MENLTKEYFWNPLMIKCPDSVKEFCQWIDEYKKSVDWDELFGNNAPLKIRSWAKIKFHDIPGPMQFGILLHYFRERGGCYFEVDIFNDDWKEVIEQEFERLQRMITENV